ncbi:MAG: hypothetical protein GX537_00675 [Actinobacteria bacterium]|nr:hypothetical protein [Actinomycetota bacterium]
MRRSRFLVGGLVSGLVGALLAPCVRARSNLRRGGLRYLLGGHRASSRFGGTPCSSEDRRQDDPSSPPPGARHGGG